METVANHKAEKLPYPLFLKSFALTPRAAVNLLLENQHGEILLTKRAIPPCEDMWHYPGSYVLKYETLEVCLQRVALEELGLDITGMPYKLAGVFDDLFGDSRGHTIDIMYVLRLTDSLELHTNKETKEMQFFSSLPENIGFNHRETLESLGYS